MRMIFELLGLSPMGSSMVPAEHGKKPGDAKEVGKPEMDGLRRVQRPSSIMTREGPDNAIAATATSGGSTNAFQHLKSHAAEVGVELGLEDFDRIAEATATTCDLKP